MGIVLNAAILVALTCRLLAGAEAPPRGDAAALIAAGKDAVARYSEDPTVHAGAIVDAAVAYELAHRAAGPDADPALVAEIQASLYWCRKRMDVEAMQQYRSRVDALPAADAAAPARPAARGARPQPPAPPLQAARPVDPPVLERWVARLQERVRADIRAGREPHFDLSSLLTRAILRELADDGGMILACGGGELSYPWRLLSMQDLAAIAAGLPRGDDPAGQALAAFFLIASGAEAAGRERLLRSGAQAADVERAFTATAAR